jgi:hypothetical protein
MLLFLFHFSNNQDILGGPKEQPFKFNEEAELNRKCQSQK